MSNSIGPASKRRPVPRRRPANGSHNREERIAFEIGRRLSAVRKDSGLTQEEVSQQTDFSLAAIKNYERGARRPTSEYVIYLAETFGVSADWLLIGRGEKKISEKR